MSKTNKVERQPAYIVHRRAYRETSQLVDLFTRDYGRISAVRRGARGRYGAGSAQPLQALLVSWTGRTDLKTLVAAERIDTGPMAQGERLYSALYINELLLRLLPPHAPFPALFERYARLIPTVLLAEDIEVPLRQFELALLAELGYAADLTRIAATGDEPALEQYYVYQSGIGLVPAGRGDIEQAVRGDRLGEIAKGDFSDPETRRLAKRLMRERIAELLGGRPLLSRQLFQSRKRDPEASASTDGG
jgi:DNA repair protein RecO (recombination protein O)